MPAERDPTTPLIEVLGTGNAFHPLGRMHACLLLDGCILIDAPPTILPQLSRAGRSPADIDHLLISHWHADHVFGLPFLLLHRRYISDVEEMSRIRIHLRPGGPGRMTALCETGFPGSLGEVIESRVEWCTAEASELGESGWSQQRFPVRHTPETDPHGYLLKHESGLTLLHCCDSGPCSSINERLDEADAVVVDMGVPDFVETDHHHRPADIERLCLRYPTKMFLVTHSFAMDEAEEGGFEQPALPANAVQLRDGDRFQWSADRCLLEQLDRSAGSEK